MTDFRFILIVIKKIPLFYVAIFAVFSLTSASNDSKVPYPCLEFTNPAQFIPVKSYSCTLSVKSCPSIQSVSFKAQYISKDDSLPCTISLGHITRQPFRLIWDLSKIPNQLTKGITCFAEVVLENGKIEMLKQEGIFLTHNPIVPPVYKISYTAKGNFNSNRQSITLTSPTLSSTAQANISWNGKALLFYIKVHNTLFYNTLPKAKLEKLGVKISLDTQNKRDAYLSKDILIFIIPVFNKPYRLITESVYNPDGSFEIKKKRNTCKYYSSVETENFKGYTVDFAIPQKALGTTIPHSIGCNIMATVLDEKSTVKELSWIQGNHYTISSPFAYGKLILLGKPLLTNLFLLWIIYFILGILLGITAIFIYKAIRKFDTLTKFERYEHESQLIKNINAIVEAEITNKNFSIDDIASRLTLTSKKVNAIIRRHFGKTFKKRLITFRIEIVKERLRSSNASEISIANSCGFLSVDEMEKKFRAFCGTTPYKYREEHRVT